MIIGTLHKKDETLLTTMTDGGGLTSRRPQNPGRENGGDRRSSRGLRTESGARSICRLLTQISFGSCAFSAEKIRVPVYVNQQSWPKINQSLHRTAFTFKAIYSWNACCASQTNYWVSDGTFENNFMDYWHVKLLLKFLQALNACILLFFLRREHVNRNEMYD